MFLRTCPLKSSITKSTEKCSSDLAICVQADYKTEPFSVWSGLDSQRRSIRWIWQVVLKSKNSHVHILHFSQRNVRNHGSVAYAVDWNGVYSIIFENNGQIANTSKWTRAACFLALTRHLPSVFLLYSIDDALDRVYTLVHKTEVSIPVQTSWHFFWRRSPRFVVSTSLKLAMKKFLNNKNPNGSRLKL